MTNPRHRRHVGDVFSLKYHLVWCSKYRLPVLLQQKASELDIAIEALEIMPDPVHGFVSSDPTEAPQRIANQFKGFTSGMPSLWSRNYYEGSIGQVSVATVKRYIAEQKGRH
jgi:REP-associated tyrosine transposase